MITKATNQDGPILTDDPILQQPPAVTPGPNCRMAFFGRILSSMDPKDQWIGWMAPNFRAVDSSLVF